ncbi:unnamed protein product [Schistosoma curassoni]|uniref:Uncharacterized protein n=1 Tax=Schistosoma curassoni TaxID=6186 RepID=A0A183KT91_9TREM|nr:unnamed protein product [Schistosoma curassoni]
MRWQESIILDHLHLVYSYCIFLDHSRIEFHNAEKDEEDGKA